ncbi:MAG: FN3 associated domain-containing protein, partial [Akkermansiaceae bacterium]
IRYTTNGSKPSASSGSIYAGPIAITPETGSSTRGTRRVRAIAIHPTAALTPVATHTYIFVNGTGNPLTNGVLGQSNFQSSIKNHPTYGPLMDDGLLALPAISIVKPSGISGSEGETSIELISVDGSEAGFQIDCGIKIVGGASVGSPKNNFRCYFRSQYGSAKLRYPLYANHPYTKGASEEFDVIQLRSGSHDNFFWMARPSNPPIGFRHGDAQYIRNRFTWDAEMLMGHPSLHGRWAHCYLNGAYHGIYHIHERPMHNYLDKYFGGDPEDYHYTNSARNGSDHGGGDTWSSTWQQVKRAASAGGQQSKDWINWESLADNQLLYFYFGNDWDWTTNHNWMAAGPQNPGEGGWRFYSWDCDVSMYDIAANNLNQNAPDGVFNSMMNDPDFKVFFRDRVYKHCFHGGVLRPDGLRAAHDYRMNELFEAIVPETARWQPSSSTSAPWDRDGEWQTEWNYMKNVYWPRRTAILLNQIRSRGWYPVEAPEFTPHGGNVASGFSPIINGSGTIYVTTDGSDPRLPGGAVNPEAQAFTGSSVNTTLVSRGSMWKFLDDGTDFATTAWRQPAYDDSAWVEDDAEFGYGDGDEATVVSYGPFSSEKYITTYFRKKFNVANVAAVSSLVLELKRDDGAVVYINGTEVWRANMEEGIVIGPDTLAFVGQREPEENSFFLKNDVRRGDHVLASRMPQQFV